MMPNSVVHASLDLDREPVPAEQSVQGEVTSGDATVDEFGDLGAATLEFATGSETLHLGPGDVVRFSAGAVAVWTVTETLRKVYLTAG